MRPSKTVRSATDLLLYSELYGTIAFDIKDMWQAFEHVDTAELLRYAQTRGLYTGSKWRDWPVHTSESRVLTWLLNLFGELQSRAPSHTSSPWFELRYSGNLLLKDGDCTRKTDILVIKKPVKISNSNPRKTGPISHGKMCA